MTTTPLDPFTGLDDWRIAILAQAEATRLPLDALAATGEHNLSLSLEAYNLDSLDLPTAVAVYQTLTGILAAAPSPSVAAATINAVALALAHRLDRLEERTL